MKAAHCGPLGGMIVICVEPGTEVTSEDGTTAVVDDSHTVISGKGALYVTPKIWELLKEQTVAKTATPAENISNRRAAGTVNNRQ